MVLWTLLSVLWPFPHLDLSLREVGWRGLTAAICRTAVVVARDESPQLAPVDVRLPGESGLAAVRDLKSLDSSTVIVVPTGYGSIATAVDSIKLGAASYLTKPADADRLRSRALRAVCQI